jgi:pSer/pThr/pTyr-binding forkhead associated (FHA) protein
MACLEYAIDDQRYEGHIKADENTVGRSPECPLQSPRDAELSLEHGTFRRHADGSFVLLGHGSANGTCLNKHRVGSEEAPLHDGGRARVGMTVFVFRQAPIG